MHFLGNVLFLGKMRRFRKLLSNSSSTSLSEEDTDSAIEKGLWLKIFMHSNKLHDLNQKTNPNIRYFTIINGTSGMLCNDKIKMECPAIIVNSF